MGDILQQLGLNATFFTQLGIFFAVFLILSHFYFKPFLHLFEERHKKTVRDRQAAEQLMKDASQRLEEYQKRLSEERATSKKEYDALLASAKKEEAELIGKAREEAKKITQDAADAVAAQKESLRKQLQGDVDSLAQAISEKLLSRKV